jgi:hypothetical protein
VLEGGLIYFSMEWTELIIGLITGLFGGALIEFKLKVFSRAYKIKQKNRSLQKVGKAIASPAKNAGRDFHDNSTNFTAVYQHQHYYFDDKKTEYKDSESTLGKSQIDEINNEKELSLTKSDQKLISCINLIHFKNQKKYNFENDLRDYIFHRKFKPGKRWYFSASGYLAQAIQDIGPEKFFNSFEQPSDPRKINEFIFLKNEITICYHTEIQKMRHTDKGDKLKKEFISPNGLKNGERELPESEMEKILDKFYENLKRISEFPIKM